MRPTTFRPITVPDLHFENLKVGELPSEMGQWNWSLIEQIFWPIDHDEFRRFPIYALSGRDKIIWHYTSNGIYSVRSGYHLAMGKVVGSSDGISGGNARYFRKLWHLNIQSKIKIFIWKAIHVALPCRLHLAARGISTENTCPRCHDFPEHSFHALWLCSGAKEVWSESALWPPLSRFKGQSFMDLWSWVILFGRGDELGSFAMISWSIWLDRNHLVHVGKVLTPKDVVSRAGSLWEQFLACQPRASPKASLPSQPNSWSVPPKGIVKINVDAAMFLMFLGSQRVGIGVVARNDQGFVLMAQTLCLDGIFSVHVAELLAAREGMIMASQNQWNHVILETDASNVARSIAHSLQYAEDDDIISFIRHLGSRLSTFQVQHCRRTTNVVAHILATHGMTQGLSLVFKEYCLLFISKSVRLDLVGV